MLERMDDFFTARINGYDEHMKSNIEGASLFYKFTAALLPVGENAKVLDLGCGTGLELEEFFLVNPNAIVTGIDLTEAMLDSLKAKFPDKDITTICGSYFDVPFGDGIFDAAVSVESLHHFSKEEKIPLYAKLWQALKPDGYLILTDYFAETDEQETFFRQEQIRLRKEQNLPDEVFYHYDTPLTVEHEKEALIAAGFTKVEVLNHWEATYTLKAGR
ncbi:class I SAM-dependent methyltransferase [Butyrivibrio sp. MB2005]|uniref:class I SAM-dependent methyltransferase n=1 Tax=Butyrivibrio sp. MB2005 TaxID=1280678 RepID=UPI0004126E71|nr:class I SAM-dependent methyltransferase [Butyrivibrio sp. MB2005]